jgi:hypothetical protein
MGPRVLPAHPHGTLPSGLLGSAIPLDVVIPINKEDEHD